jgi:hypothetical protein
MPGLLKWSENVGSDQGGLLNSKDVLLEFVPSVREDFLLMS